MQHISTNELERKLKEKKVELIRLLHEEELLRSKQRELLNKLEQKQALNREKIEQHMWEPELDNQVGVAVVGDSHTIKSESTTKEEKNEAEEEQRWEKTKSAS